MSFLHGGLGQCSGLQVAQILDRYLGKRSWQALSCPEISKRLMLLQYLGILNMSSNSLSGSLPSSWYKLSNLVSIAIAISD